MVLTNTVWRETWSLRNRIFDLRPHPPGWELREGPTIHPLPLHGFPCQLASPLAPGEGGAPCPCLRHKHGPQTSWARMQSEPG